MRFFTGALALASLLVLVACEKEPEGVEPENDEAHWAAVATIGSDSPFFSGTEDGGRIRFETGGGETVVRVDCGTDWTVYNRATDLFTTSVNLNEGTLTVTAVQNTVEEELGTTVTLVTAGQRIEFATLHVTQNAYGAVSITLDSEEWKAPAVGALSTDIAVSCSLEDYDVEVSEDWLGCERTETGIRLTALENEDTESRSAEVVLSASDGFTSSSRTVAVTQDGLARLDFSDMSVRFGSFEETIRVEVESNFDWDWSFDSSWCTISREGNTLIAKALENASETAREAVVTLTAGDGAENTVVATLPVTQFGVTPLVFVHRTSAPDTEITLPLDGEVSCTVDWGDGSTVQTVSTTYPSHTYAEAGDHVIAVDGRVTALNNVNEKIATSSASPNTTLIAVKQWGLTGLTDLHYGLIYSSSLVSVPTDKYGALSEVTSCNRLFSFCLSLESVPEGIFDHCSKVESFEQAFRNCVSLKSLPKGLFDACSSVTSFRSAFYICSSLTDLPSGLFDKCPEVTSFYNVFYSCSSLKTVPAGLFAGNPKATDFYGAFDSCSSLQAVPEGMFDGCSLAEDFGDLFYECKSLSSVPERLFADCVKASTFEYAFYGCSSLKAVPAGLFAGCSRAKTFEWAFASCQSLASVAPDVFDGCSGATSFYATFYQCKLLSSIPSGLFDTCVSAKNFSSVFYACPVIGVPEKLFANCPEVTNFSYAFYNCVLSEIPAGLFAGCSKVTNFSSTFYNNVFLEKVPEGLFDNCPDVTNVSFIFRGCTNITEVPTSLFSNNRKITNFQTAFYNMIYWAGESPYSEIDGKKVHLYERTAEDGFSVPTSTNLCFEGCTALEDYDLIPASWGGPAEP